MKISFTVGKPETGEPVETARPPLKILVLADLLASHPTTEPVVLEEAGGFAELLARLQPRLVLDVANKLGHTPQTLEVTLTVSALKDLSPAALAERVPQLAKVKGFAGLLESVRNGERELDQLAESLNDYQDIEALGRPIALCREALDPARAPASSPAPGAASGTAAPRGSSVNRILDMVDLPEDQQREQRAASAIGGIISAVSKNKGKRQGRATPPQLERALELTGRLLGKQLDAIYHHPELKRLEATWRGLKFLADRTDFRQQARLEVMHLPKRDLRRTFHDAIAERMLAGAEDSPTLIVAAYLLSNPADAELLQGLAEDAEALQSPILFSVDAGWFGLEDGAEATDLRYPGSLFEQPRYIKWNALRDKQCSRWISAAFNRFLLREPYSARSAKEWSFDETVAQRSDHLWGDPAWVVASLVARSFAAVGWPTEITGTEWGRVEDLPLHQYHQLGGHQGQLPLEAYLPQQLVQDLGRSGIIALFAPEDTDNAYVLHAPTVYRPRSSEEPTSTGRSLVALPYQLLAARVAQALANFKPKLAGIGSTEEVQRSLERFAREVVANTGPGSWSEVTVEPSPEGQLQVSLELRTGRAVLRGAPVEFGFTLHR